MGPLVDEFERARRARLRGAARGRRLVRDGRAPPRRARARARPGRRGDRAGLHLPGDRERRRARGRPPGARRRRPGDDEPRPRAAADASTPRTKAVLAVHLFGRPLDWEWRSGARPRRCSRTPPARSARAAAAARAAALGVVGCLSLPPAQDRHDRRGRRGHDRRRPGSPTRSARPRNHGIGARWPTPTCRAGHELPALGHPLRGRDPAAPPARRAARRAPRASPRATPSASRDCRAHAVGRRGRRARLAGLRDPARPARRGARRRCARRGSRRRSGPTRSTASSAYRDQGPFPGAEPPSRARSRCRSTRASPTPTSTGSPRRCARTLDKVVSEC